MTTRYSLNKLEGLKDSVLVEFDNAGDMFRELDGNNSLRYIRNALDGRNAFYSNVKWSSLETLVQQGDEALAKRSRALLDKLKAASPATVKRIRTSKPFGRAVTGAYLSSDPMPCRSRVKVKSDTAPLTIAVNVASSAMTSSSDLEKRGIAIAALVQKLSLLRPVRLVLVGLAQCSRSKPVAFACDFPTRPLDAYRLAWLLSSQGFARGMGFACYQSASDFYAKAGGQAKACHNEGFITWAGGQAYSNNSGPNTFGAALAKHWRGDVFYIPSAGSDGDNYRKMLNSPVEWINENVTALSK